MDTEPNGGVQTDEPHAKRLSRREFMKYSALATGAVIGGVAVLKLLSTEQTEEETAIRPPNVPEGHRQITLSNLPSQNPGFSARALPDGGALAWTRREDGSVTAFAVNAHGRALWELCDGQTKPGDICGRYATSTGRSAAEGEQFLADLRRKGLVVDGGYIIAAAGFPDASETGRYMHALDGKV